MNSADPNHSEIIIIKRSNSEEEGHHGGAWKIAFADFMTAMMALFLVLWLINAANEETKRAVASYFNPVKLVDRNRSSKGINDQKSGPTSDPNESIQEKKETEPAADNPQETQGKIENDDTLEENLKFFASPQEQLDQILRTAMESPMLLGTMPKAQPDAVAENFLDPFGPDFMNQVDDKAGKGVTDDVKSELSVQTETGTDVVKDSGKVSAIDPQKKTPHVEENPPIEDKNLEKEKLVSDLKMQVQEALSQVTSNSKALEEIIEFKPVDEGILISVTDELDVPMFNVGSAIPEALLVVAVDAIAKTLATKSGPLHVFGHTDSREFKNAADGNWQLSTDRAKATYFMLIHGGLEDDRIVEIAGYADRKLRNADDPLARENRRIEILLETK